MVCWYCCKLNSCIWWVLRWLTLFDACKFGRWQLKCQNDAVWHTHYFISGACGGCSVSSGTSLFPVQKFGGEPQLFTTTVQSRCFCLFGHGANGWLCRCWEDSILLTLDCWKDRQDILVSHGSRLYREWHEIPQPHTDWGTWYGSELLTLEAVDSVWHYTL